MQTSIGALVLAVAGLGAPVVHAQQFRASVGAVSDYAVHGLTRSDGDPALQAEASVAGTRGTALGAWASSVNLNPGAGADMEFAVFLGQRVRLGLDTSLEARLSRYFYPEDQDVLPYDYTELRIALAFRDSVELAGAWSPDWSTYSRYGPARDEPAAWIELAAAYPVSPAIRLTGGVGYADVSNHTGTGYSYFSGGLEWTWRELQLGLGYVATDKEGERLFGTDRAGGRVVVSAIWTIR